MYFRRSYQPGYSSVRDYYTDTAALYRYWRILSSRNRIRRKPLHRYHRSSLNPGTGYDPLLYFALGYLMAASDRDPVARIINGMPPDGPAGGPGNEGRPFEIRLTDRVVFHGPLDCSNLYPSHRNRQQY